jgi:hypothetical protein
MLSTGAWEVTAGGCDAMYPSIICVCAFIDLGLRCSFVADCFGSARVVQGFSVVFHPVGNNVANTFDIM